MYVSMTQMTFNFLPNEKNYSLVEIESNCGRQNKLTEKLKFVLGRVENIVGQGENAGYQLFLLFPQRFKKASFSMSLKVLIVW